MKKFFPILIVSLMILASLVFAQNAAVSSDVQDMVKTAVAEKGINQADIKSVEQVDFNNLPPEINIQNIDNTSLSLYKVDDGSGKPFYLISVSEEKFKQVAEKIAGKMLLNFGYKDVLSTSGFLESSVGTQTSLEKGYVMMRKGSVTGLSTSLEITSTDGTGDIEVILYKNGKEVGFRNILVADKTGVKKDYDTISEKTINFEPGDVISAYAKINGNVQVKDINSLIEIITLETNWKEVKIIWTEKTKAR